MIFTDEPVEREVQTRGIYNLNFEIPPGDGNYEVRAEYDLPVDTEVLALFPHMHFRGKDWKYIAKFPDGREQILLHVPRYDFNWQESYILKTPLFMPKGTTLQCIAHYDNSDANFANPDPTKVVSWGEQTWEEMMIGYFDHVPAQREENPAAAASGEVTPGSSVKSQSGHDLHG